MADVKELNINNTTYDIKAKSVVDNNSGAVKFWTGTKAQYDAIVTKDANTLYNITDDTDVTPPLLELLYPIGSIYIGTMANCPLQILGVGTWQFISTGIVKAGDIPVKGNGKTIGLTDGTNNVSIMWATGTYNRLYPTPSGYDKTLPYVQDSNFSATVGTTFGLTTDDTKSGIIGDTSSLELSCNIWERVS